MSRSPGAVTPEEILAHGRWLHRLARRLLVPDDEAVDLVQETWAAAVRAAPDRGRPLRPWLAGLGSLVPAPRRSGAAEVSIS